LHYLEKTQLAGHWRPSADKHLHSWQDIERYDDMVKEWRKLHYLEKTQLAGHWRPSADKHLHSWQDIEQYDDMVKQWHTLHSLAPNKTRKKASSSVNLSPNQTPQKAVSSDYSPKRISSKAGFLTILPDDSKISEEESPHSRLRNAENFPEMVAPWHSAH